MADMIAIDLPGTRHWEKLPANAEEDRVHELLPEALAAGITKLAGDKFPCSNGARLQIIMTLQATAVA